MSWNGQTLVCFLEPSRSAKGVAQVVVPVSAPELDWLPQRELRALLLREFVRACDGPGVPHGAEVFPSLDPDDYTLERRPDGVLVMDLRGASWRGGRAMPALEGDMRTYWNGEPCEARRVLVRIPEDASFPNAWWKDWEGHDLTGEVVRAVEVAYGGETFFLADEAGSAWAKVTLGFGSPRYGHRSLPDDCEVVEAVDAEDEDA